MTAPAPAKPSVLIADDHPAIRLTLRRFLDRTRHRVVGEAVDGQDAVELTGRLSPDIVLLDVSMPRLNGLQAARAIRRQYVKSRIVMLSMHDRQEYVLRAFRAGARGYVLKEDCGDELDSAIERVHQGHLFCSTSICECLLVDSAGGPELKKRLALASTLSASDRRLLTRMGEDLTVDEMARHSQLSSQEVLDGAARIRERLKPRSDDDLRLVALKLYLEHC